MTAVEWLIEEIECRGIITKELRIAFQQAKEMEKEQIIEFAEWLTYNRENNYTKSIKELLEIYKKTL